MLILSRVFMQKDKEIRPFYSLLIGVKIGQNVIFNFPKQKPLQ